MIVSMHQPAYLPWLGYFHKIAVSDVFVVFNTTQFEKGSFINRNRINGPNSPFWLSVNIKRDLPFGENLINRTKINNCVKWQWKHWKAICGSYAKTPYWSEYGPLLEPFYLSRRWELLDELCLEMLHFFLDALNIKTKIIRSSILPSFDSKKSELVLDICKYLGATIYLSGTHGRGYLDKESFHAEQISVCYQNFKHPIYPQLYHFTPYMCILDLLLNNGRNSLQIILQENMTSDDIKCKRLST